MSSLKELSNMTECYTVITGGTGNLGAVIAETFAELGSYLIVVDQKGSNFSKLESKLRNKWSAKSTFIECDLEHEKDREKSLQKIKSKFDKIHCLVNNAAFVGSTQLNGWSSSFEKQSLATWRRATEVNLTAPFHFAQGLFPELKSSGSGNIINIASIYGEWGPDWSLYDGTKLGNPAAYNASKGGLLQLTRWLATTLAPDVRVNAISPGGILRSQPANFIKRYEKRAPLQRMATENDFRGAIAFLGTKLSNYVTGQNLRVDGGWSAW